MDGSTVRVHAPQHRYCLQLLDIPNKHHAVTVEHDRTIVEIVDGTCNHICELGCLVLLYLYAAVASEKICGAEGRRLTQTKQVLKSVSGKYSNYTI